MDEKKGLLGCLLLVSAVLLHCAVAKEEELQAHVGTNVTLPCKVDIEHCGTLHSVKWYRDTSRIYVLSQAGHIARGEGDAVARMNVIYNKTVNETPLTIFPVHMNDESTYKCEITYLEVRENCDVVQIVKLTTLVKPDAVHIEGYDGREVQDSDRLPAKDEGEQVSLTCSATGKPIPTILWYNNSEIMNRASYSTKPGNITGFGTGMSTLQLILSRGDLNARYECRVESQALTERMSSAVTIDLKVLPTKMVLSGGENPVKQGDRVTLTCTVFEARPEASIRWINGTNKELKNGTDNVFIDTFSKENSDGTKTTISTLTFIASRWENNKYFYCKAQHEVLERKKTLLNKFKLLIVQYPPVITANASAATLTETENKTEEVTFTINYHGNPQNLLEVTWLKDGEELVRVKGKHLHGDKDNPTLQIKRISREDMGEYTCRLRNEVGEELSDPIFLDILYPPDVEVVMEPSRPVKATDQTNVTLVCNVTDGNPTWLRKVLWLLDGEVMADLPECNYSQPAAANETLGGPFCGIDPSILSLIKVDHSFAGNYTCQGQNDAGRYGPVSRPRTLEVYYPPKMAKLRHYPSTVIKNGEVNLICEVEDPGQPDNVTYEWYRGSHLLRETQTSNLTIHKASLETRSNFTCVAKNAGGKSEPAYDNITVLAPPAFIGNLNSYKGVLYSAPNVSLTCRIECYPACSVIWFKDGHRLDTENNHLYYVNIKEHPADVNKNDFESIESTLVWDMKNWPDQMLNKSAPHSHYTCAGISKGTQRRPNVTFTTEVAIDFPPEDLQVSETVVHVDENKSPEAVKCSGKGRPKLSYVWKKNSTGELIGKDDTLQLGKMPKSAAGNYTCEAFNKYGNKTVNVYFDVKYEPECTIEVGDREGKQVLVCSARGNPPYISYKWRIHEYNDTVEYTNNNAFLQEGFSYLYLDTTVEIERTYECIANNSVGSGFCNKKIPAHQEQSSQTGEPGHLPPWYRDSHNLIVVLVSVITLILCVIIVCVIIIVMCRKKRQNAKCNNPLEMEEREKPDGQSPDTSGQSKWPLRPGVLVHVSKLHNVNISQLSPDSTPFGTSSVAKTSTFLKYKKNKSKVYARLQRLKDLLGFSGHDRLPSGITEGASGVVTYKKIKPTTPVSQNSNSRKRKKPGYAPNPSSTGDKMRLGAAPPVGGSADPANDHDKGFYENLPFHGMQNPPNKPISVIAPFTQDTTHTFTPKSPLPATPTAFAPCNKIIQRHQSFHGFQNNQQMQLTNVPARFNFNRNLSNPYLNSWSNPWPNWPNFLNKNFHSQNITNQQVAQPFRFPQARNNFQPILNFNPFLLPNPFSVLPQTIRVPGRREADVRRTASGINISENEKPKDETNSEKIASPMASNNDKRFGSLELKKHKCYSPTFYSMRCKKHAKKRPVVYALPKKVFGDLKPPEEKKPDVYQDLTDSIQIFEQNADNEPPKAVPVPAPRCKKHRKNEIIYQNVSQQLQQDLAPNPDVSNSSNDGSENLESEISVIEAQVHTQDDRDESKPEIPRSPPKLVGVSPKANVSIDSNIIKVEAMKALKSSPMLKVSPNFIKPKTESPKGALSLQIQAKMKNSNDNLNQTDDSSKENLPLIPQMPLLNPQNKWSPGLAKANQQNAFYTLTTPHYKHMSVGLPPQYSATIPHQKHTKLIPRALFNEQLPKSKSFSSKPKHKKHFQIPLQKCHSFKFQTAESYFQPIKNIHEEDLMKNGYVSDYPESSRGRHHKREKPKQKTKGPLVLRRPNEYHENVQFPENVQNSVQLQYPQPVLGRSMKKPNGVVYADLDMPKTNSKKGSHETSSSQSKSQKSKPKTEYATLSFNDIGQEIDV